MANYSNNRYASQDVPSINTNSIPLFNDNICLKLTFMNDSMALRFIPAVPRDDGTNSYPKDTGSLCVLKIDYAVLLFNWLNQYFIPVAKDNFKRQIADPTLELDPVMVGIPTNKDNTNMLVFKYEAPVNGALVPSVTFHSGIDMSRKPAHSITYKFGTKGIFTKYDENTGEFAQHMEQIQFWVFLKTLEKFIDASTMAEAHAQKLGSSYVNREMRDLIRQIAVKNGIQVYNGNQNKGQSNRPQFTESNAPAPEVTLNDMMALPGGDEMPF